MPRYNTIVFLLFLLAIGTIFMLAASPATAFAQGGLVPSCNTLKDAEGNFINLCTTCHLFVLLQNVANFVWLWISIPIAAFMFAWGGFLMIFSPANPSNIQKGKKIIWNTMVGLSIVFFAWLAIDTIIKLVAGQNIGSGQPATIRGYGPWNKLTCTR